MAIRTDKSNQRRVNGSAILDPDHSLNEFEAAAYSEERGYPLTVSRLRASRMRNPTCKGPKFEKVDGWHVIYTPRYLDEFIKQIERRVFDPADRLAAS